MAEIACSKTSHELKGFTPRKHSGNDMYQLDQHSILYILFTHCIHVFRIFVLFSTALNEKPSYSGRSVFSVQYEVPQNPHLPTHSVAANSA